MHTSIEHRDREPRQSPRGALGLALVLATMAAGCAAAGEDRQSEQSARDNDGRRVINVEVTSVDRGAFTDSIRVAGSVEAYRDVTISADEGGAIRRYLVPRGARVSVGSVIAELDSGVLEAQVAEARAAAALAGEQFERQRRLWEVERIGTEIAFLRAKYDAEMADARLATLASRLERTKVRSPIDGVFDQKFLEAGEYAGVGDPVARVVTTNPIKVTAGIPERYAAFVRRADSARITFDVLPGREFYGRIAFVGTSVNAANRTFPIEVVIRNPEGLVKPQMIADLQVVRQRLDDVIVVPQTAVLRTEDGYQVVLADSADGRPVAKMHAVTVGPSYANQVVIESGLEPGARLITLGQQLVDDGSLIRVVNEETGPSDSAARVEAGQ
ncbi:MAG TPA: efflux RND transporter periplasmic adaptor subunit [Gemmatimonadales bacterium]|nr:efflux RND transporter periplasmic adaptor subunit [Gemmatimonadales bacterium]